MASSPSPQPLTRPRLLPGPAATMPPRRVRLAVISLLLPQDCLTRLCLITLGSTLDAILLRTVVRRCAYPCSSRDSADRLGGCRQPEVLGGRCRRSCAQPRRWGGVRRGGLQAFSDRGSPPTAGSRRVGGGVSLQPSRLLLDQLRRPGQVGSSSGLGPAGKRLYRVTLGLVGPDEMSARALGGWQSRWWGTGGPLTGSAARGREHLG
jgi:hypothetical protein